MSPFSSILQNRLQRYYKFFKYTRFLAKKYRLCSHKRSFLLKRLLFARKCERTFEGENASFPRSLQQCPKGAQRMMKGCSKVASPFVTLLITYSSAANTSTAQSSFLNFLQRYNKYLKYTRILAIKCNFICILCYKALLFAQLCDCIFGGFLIYKGVPTIQQIFVYFFLIYANIYSFFL